MSATKNCEEHSSYVASHILQEGQLIGKVKSTSKQAILL